MQPHSASPVNRTFPDPRDLAPPSFHEQTAQLGISPERSRRLFAAVVGKNRLLADSWQVDGIITKRERALAQDLPVLEPVNIVTSTIDRFTKLAYRTPQGDIIETVLIPLLKPNCFTVCLSSQVGCAMACAFCATARMPQRRSLQTWEIVAQFMGARELARTLGGRVTGAVFMGMGEPFLNYERVISAANVLRHPADGAIRGKAITISTVGLIDEIDRFTASNLPFRLSISIGAALDEKRRILVPVAARYPIAEVMAAARRHATARRDRVMISYVCISGFNVSDEDAQALGEIIGDTPVRLDLIDVTDSTGRFLPPSEEELRNFRDALSRYVRQPVARRYSGGKEIQAACGTLAASVSHTPPAA